jgi:NTE family protein
VELIMATADTATEASVSAAFTAFERTVADWQSSLIQWRCGLSEEQRRRYGARPGWNCRDLKFYVNRVAFEQLGQEREAALNKVETRFSLPADQVDMLITAGGDALRGNRVFRDFLASVGGRAGPPRPTAPKPQAPNVASVSAGTTGMAFAR